MKPRLLIIIAVAMASLFTLASCVGNRLKEKQQKKEEIHEEAEKQRKIKPVNSESYVIYGEESLGQFPYLIFVEPSTTMISVEKFNKKSASWPKKFLDDPDIKFEFRNEIRRLFEKCWQYNHPKLGKKEAYICECETTLHYSRNALPTLCFITDSMDGWQNLYENSKIIDFIDMDGDNIKETVIVNHYFQIAGGIEYGAGVLVSYDPAAGKMKEIGSFDYYYNWGHLGCSGHRTKVLFEFIKQKNKTRKLIVRGEMQRLLHPWFTEEEEGYPDYCKDKPLEQISILSLGVYHFDPAKVDLIPETDNVEIIGGLDYIDDQIDEYIQEYLK